MGSMMLLDLSAMQDAFSKAITSVQGDIMGYFVIALPVGLAVYGAFIAVKKGLKFFSNILNG